MPVIGTAQIPVAPRGTAWDAAGAKRRVFEACTDNEGKVGVACVSRAFLWRKPNADARDPDSYSLGFADMIDGRLHIVPRGLAATAGGRGIGTVPAPDDDKATIRARITSAYARVRQSFADWPLSPWEARTASITADADGDAWEGTIAFEGIDSGDGRRFAKGSLRWEDGPWPLVFDREDMDHTAMVVGTVNEIVREGNEIRARGNLSDSEDPETQTAVVRVRELFNEGAVGVSILIDEDVWADPKDPEDMDEVMVVKTARIRHVAIVDVPAFNRARVALVASVKATAEWFGNPGFGNGVKDPTQDGDDDRLVWQEPEHPEEVAQYGAPLTITDDGRIFGHAALWFRCHVGYAGTCVRPPREPAAYRGYLTGARIPGIPSGPLVMRTTHAPNHLTAEAAQVHYDHTGYAGGDITIGPDAYGIWVAGAVRSDASESDIEVMRASALSGDWRPVAGRHRLIGVLAVSGPGFRVARALAASGALVTIGPGCTSCEDTLSLEERIALLERLYAQSLVAGL